MDFKKSKLQLQEERDRELEAKRRKRQVKSPPSSGPAPSSKPFISGNSRLALFRKSQRTPWASAKLLQCAWRQLAARRILERLQTAECSRQKAASAQVVQGLASGRRVRQRMYAAEAEEPALVVVRALRRNRQKLLIMDSMPSLAPMMARATPDGSLKDVDNAVATFFHLTVSTEKKVVFTLRFVFCFPPPDYVWRRPSGCHPELPPNHESGKGHDC